MMRPYQPEAGWGTLWLIQTAPDKVHTKQRLDLNGEPVLQGGRPVVDTHKSHGEILRTPTGDAITFFNEAEAQAYIDGLPGAHQGRVVAGTTLVDAPPIPAPAPAEPEPEPEPAPKKAGRPPAKK